MTFQEAVHQARPPVNDAYEPGLQALGNHSRAVRCNTPRQVTGSICLDKALAESLPNEPRWDYGVGLKRTRSHEAIWVEVHPASTSDVDRMLDKLSWLRKWLRNDAPALDSMTRHAARPFYWVATAGIHINANSPQARRLAQSGLRRPTRALPLPPRG